MAGYSVTYTIIDEATAKIEAINKRIQAARAPIERMQRSVQRLIDTSGLQKIAAGFQSIARSALAAVESVARLVPAFGAIVGAASLAGMAKLVTLFSDLSAELSHTATGLNVSSQRLQEYQNSIRLAGGSVEDMTQSLKGLASASYGAILGRDPIAAQTFARAGIALKNANGTLRDATELLPEAIQYVDKFTLAQDRAAIATQLGDRHIADLAEDYRRSGKPFAEWLRLSQEAGTVSRANQQSLLEYRQAVGKLSVSFENLGFAVSGIIGGTIAPMLNDLANYIRNNQGAIEGFIKGVGEGIKKWYEGGGAGRLLETLQAIGRVLKIVADNAELIGGIFIAKWGIEAVAAVAKLTGALGVVGGGGLLGALGAIAALAGAGLGLKALFEHPGDVAPGAGLWKSLTNILHGRAPWEGYFPDARNGSGGAAPGGGAAPSGGAPAPAPAPGGSGSSGGGAPAPSGAGGGGAPAPGGGAPTGPQGAIGPPGVTLPQMKQLALEAGFTPEEAPIIAATLMHESSGNPNAKGKAGETGIAQIHPIHGDLSRQSMGNPRRSMQIARMLYLRQGFAAWSSYNSGAYKQYLPAANAAKPEPYMDRPAGGAGGAPAPRPAAPTPAPAAPGPAAPASDRSNFVVHHTAGRGSVQGVIDTLNQRNLGVQYVMDREGNITTTGMKSAHILPNDKLGVNNRNAAGMEVIAKDDKDINERQVAAFKQFWAQHPEFRQIYGHGEVNPGHKQATEGKTITDAIRALGPDAHLGPPQAAGPPQQITPAGNGAANGEVNVTVTHKNPPPGASATASGTGQGVTVAPVRTEFADTSAI